MTEVTVEAHEETWTYAGRREAKGKRYYVWLDASGAERYYAKVPATSVGGRYIIKVRNEGERVIVLSDPVYLGDRVDVEARLTMEAQDLVAVARLAGLARERSDSRKAALDEALAPLIAIAANLKFGHERDAFLAYVIRRITQGW
jgi:hypothetical protein